MMKIKRFELDFHKSACYFKEQMRGINIFSDCLLRNVNFNDGRFFTLLPSDIDLKTICDFNSGGKTHSLKIEVAKFIFRKMEMNNSWTCIFDDYDAELVEKEVNELYLSNGISIDGEVFYVVDNKCISVELILKCLRFSDVMWHSLCAITETDFSDVIDKKMSLEKINEVSLNTKMILIGAYDAESYVIWEKN